MKSNKIQVKAVRLPKGKCCSSCASCAYFGSKGGVDWCFHPCKNWSTSASSGSGCPYYK